MLLTILGSLTTAYLGVCAYLYLFQDRILYVPSVEFNGTPDAIGLDYEDVTLTASDNVKLHGWYVPHPQPRAVALFFHGNGGNISQRLESVSIFHQLRLSTFILDYHGYGRSGGRPSEQATYLDAQAAWEYLVNERGIAPERIIVFGRSLGGAVAAWLAARHRPRAVVIESTFTSLPEVAAETYPLLPVRWLTRYRYCTLKNLRRVQCPVLIAHSRDDAVIPFHHGTRLYEALCGVKDFLELTGPHNEGFLAHSEEYRHGIDRFISRVLGGELALQG